LIRGTFLDNYWFRGCH